MSKLVAGIGLIVFLAAVILILWAVVRNMPVIGVIAGSVIAALGLGWGLIQIVSAVSASASTRWNADSSAVSLLCGFGILGLGIGVATASVMRSRSESQPQPPIQHPEDDSTETATGPVLHSSPS